MTPTNELRFVEREIGKEKTYVVRVLQQKWTEKGEWNDDPDIVEWRDVPLVKEEA